MVLSSLIHRASLNHQLQQGRERDEVFPGLEDDRVPGLTEGRGELFPEGLQAWASWPSIVIYHGRASWNQQRYGLDVKGENDILIYSQRSVYGRNRRSSERWGPLKKSLFSHLYNEISSRLKEVNQWGVERRRIILYLTRIPADD